MTNCARMNEAFVPSVLLSETHFPYLTTQDVIADAVERIAEEGFYRGAEIADVQHPSERRRIGEIVRSFGLRLTQWTSFVLAREKLNLSSMDEAVRLQSVARIKEQIELAIECGAGTLGVLSGPDPGVNLRAEATKRLRQSLCELAEAARPYGPMNVTLEPLDREFHKKGLIGPTTEFAALMQDVRASFPHVNVSWDCAHIALLGDDLLDSLSVSRDFVRQIHLANAVLDPSDALYGDHHMPLGPPGFLDTQKMVEIFRHAMAIGVFGDRGPTVCVEMRTPEGGDPWVTEVVGRRALIEAWKQFTGGAS